MDRRFMAIFLPEWVNGTVGSVWLDNVSVGSMCQAYRQYNDYDYDAEHVEWSRLRLRRVRVGSRKGLLLDFRERTESFGSYWLVTYGLADDAPKRCYSLFFDGWSRSDGVWLREHTGNMASQLLQHYVFDISWHTFVEAVRIHERNVETANGGF